MADNKSEVRCSYCGSDEFDIKTMTSTEGFVILDALSRFDAALSRFSAAVSRFEVVLSQFEESLSRFSTDPPDLTGIH